ncbi:abietadienol/abietadienal oxidase [Heracleum sosnowskyi]|uniref:Abietadienol/abietadienal oxidase n=1 Tax=Heracleum sosnowskyi TaxID=360622 RepID=A0AAD8HSA5_9APIA|nr:abietadienol/abietadienal oxidase [Heracleum sosnowskyi]
MGEIFSSFWFLIIPTLMFIIFLTKFFKHSENNAKKVTYSRLPPGGRGLPIIGDSINWYNAVSSSHPPSFVKEQVQRYGKIFSCNLLGKRAVVSADPSFNRFIMQNEGKLFQSSYPKSFRNLVGINGVINAQGEQQKKLHSIASNMMRLDKFSFHFMKDIQMVLHQTVTNFENNEVIILQDVCRKVAINLMVNQLLGVSSEGEVDEMAHLFSDFVDGCLSVPINFPGFAFHTAMKAREKIIEKIDKIVKKHREERKSGDELAGNGLLGRLVDDESLADDTMADFVINLLFAGNETTAKTMLFAVYFLTQCPEAMKQLLEEQQTLKSRKNSSDGEDQMLTWQDYKAMPFTQCVIDETLRLGGIAIWLMREAKQDVEYQDYVIPKGCFVVPFLSAVHLDENIYEESLLFNPWRWLEPQNKEKSNWRSSPFYTPFGGGARFCPGAELARLQIALFLHHFVTTYRWTQMKEDRMSFFPSARLVNGFHIQLTR